MKDIESKVALLSYYVEGVARVARVIRNDYFARVYGRSLFLGVDSFLKLAPRLKNRMREEGGMDSHIADEITNKINKLRTDYEAYYATIRDKLAAHQQEVDLTILLETWNEIDEATLCLLSEDVSAVWGALETQGAKSVFARPAELDDPSVLQAFEALDESHGMRVGADRVAMTRPGTVAMLPSGLFQEKAMRVLTAFETFKTVVNSGLEQATAHWLLPEKASVDLLVVDACSIIDNVFDPRPARSPVSAEDSLVALWKAHDVRGIETLEGFQRDLVLESQTRELRNRFCAHVDADMALADLINLMVKFPLRPMSKYIESIWLAFRSVCMQDMRTRPFLIHGQPVVGFDEIGPTDAVKPFRR